MLSKPAAGQPDEDEFKDSAGNDTGITTLAFAVGEHVSGSIEIPHDYEEGTDISFHVHWQGIAAPTGTDCVKWQCTYSLGVDDTALAAATVIATESGFDTQYAFARTDCPDIDGTSITLGQQFLFDVERIAAVGDAYAGDALVATVGVHYRVASSEVEDALEVRIAQLEANEHKVINVYDETSTQTSTGGSSGTSVQGSGASGGVYPSRC